MRDYGKVHTSFWTRGTARELSEPSRMLAFYLLTSPHSNIAGVFRLPDGYVCEDLQWTPERVAQGFAELFSKGFAYRCETTKWVWVTKHLEWNPPENPNQRKAVRKIALSVPAECSWCPDFMRACGPSLDIEVPEQKSPSRTLPEPFLNQEQEQEQEQEQDSYPASPAGLVAASDAVDPPAPKADRSACPHQKIIELYHELLPASPAIRDWTPTRAASLRARWAEDPKRQNLDYWRQLFTYVGESDFLSGRTQSRDRRPFFASLEWICKPENFAKIREGRYHEEATA